VVAVPVDAGRREDLGEPVQELESRETECGTAGRIGAREKVEDLVGAAADEVESVEREGGPGTIPDKPLQAGPVGGLDADAPVQAQPAPMLPGQHILGVVGFQEAVTAKMSQNPGADRVLETLQELAGEGRSLVEAEGFVLNSRILA